MTLRPLQIRFFAPLGFHTQWCRALPIFALACLSAFPSLGAAQPSARIKNLVEAGTLDGMRWPIFRNYQQSLRELTHRIHTLPCGFKDGSLASSSSDDPAFPRCLEERTGTRGLRRISLG